MRKLTQGTKIHVSGLGVTTHFYMGKVHREDGPAVHSEHHQIWMKAGKVHRDDGPAFVDIKNNKAIWYLYGTPIAHVDFNQPNTDQELFKSYWHKE
jgi:hypothetical protein